MIKPIVLTQTALNNYNAIVKYLIEEWDVSVANDFIKRFVEVRNMLVTNTEIFAYENKVKQIQKCVLTT